MHIYVLNMARVTSDFTITDIDIQIIICCSAFSPMPLQCVQVLYAWTEAQEVITYVKAIPKRCGRMHVLIVSSSRVPPASVRTHVQNRDLDCCSGLFISKEEDGA